MFQDDISIVTTVIAHRNKTGSPSHVLIVEHTDRLKEQLLTYKDFLLAYDKPLHAYAFSRISFNHAKYDDDITVYIDCVHRQECTHRWYAQQLQDHKIRNRKIKLEALC